MLHTLELKTYSGLNRLDMFLNQRIFKRTDEGEKGIDRERRERERDRRESEIEIMIERDRVRDTESNIFNESSSCVSSLVCVFTFSAESQGQIIIME